MPLNRRHFLFGSLAAPLLAARKAAAPAKRTNIVLIEAADVGAYALGCYGNTEIRTPNLDRLAQTGVRFADAFAAAPVASASTLRKSLASALGTAGYACGSAPELLDTQTPDKPFLLTLSWPSPAAAEATKKNLDLYAAVNFETIGRDAATGKQIEAIRKYAAGLTTLDEQIPAWLEKLRQRGLWESTLILFTSSNGYLLGQHGLFGDGLASPQVSMYEEVVRVPLIWTFPPFFPPQTMPTEVVGADDLLPTLGELAGAPFSGQSYLPLVAGKHMPKNTSWRGVALARFHGAEMLRDDHYKLVLRDHGKGANEFYDMSTDPHEKINQYDNPQFISVRDRLAGELGASRPA